MSHHSPYLCFLEHFCVQDDPSYFKDPTLTLSYRALLCLSSILPPKSPLQTQYLSNGLYEMQGSNRVQIQIPTLCTYSGTACLDQVRDVFILSNQETCTIQDSIKPGMLTNSCLHSSGLRFFLFDRVGCFHSSMALKITL